MKRSNYQWLVQVFGGMTVVASLLLVAWEVRQNTLAVSAQAIMDLNSNATDINMRIAESDQLSALLAQWFEERESLSEDLSESERTQMLYILFTMIQNYESAFFYYQKGILNELDYQHWWNQTCRFILTPGGKEIWGGQKSQFNAAFRVRVDTQCEP